MGDIVDSVSQAMAKDWVDSLTAGCHWNVQLLQKRYRRDRKTGKRRSLPFRIHRYAEGCPPGCMKAAIEYLLSCAPYKGIVFRGEELQGEYRPTKTEWLYDAGGAQNPRGGGNDGTFTLHQDLVDGEYETLPFLSGVSCTEEVYSDWHWDEDGIEDLPAPEQGVTWSIQAVSRADDGTISYALIKRVAKTSHMERTLVSDTKAGTSYRETWQNLYGEPGDFLDDSGASVPVPDPTKTPVGTTVQLSVQKNADCTYDVVAQTDVAKPVTESETTSHDQFQGQHTIQLGGQSEPLPVAPDAFGGVVHQHRSSLQPNGLYQNTDSVSVERPVSAAVKAASLTRRGRRVVVEDRNQTVPASLDDLKIGGAVKVTKTPGRLYNNEVSTWDRTKTEKVGLECHDDLFNHRDVTTTAGHDELPGGHVSGGTGGYVRTRQANLDDEGAITVSLTELKEQSVKKSKESWSMGLDGLRHTVVDTQVKNPGKAVVASVSNVGKSITNERTPGGLYNVTTTSARPVSIDRIAEGHNQTVFEHADSTTSLKSMRPTLAHPAPSGGVVTTLETALTDAGAYRVTERKTKETPVRSAEVAYRRTPKAVATTVVDRNVEDLAAPPSQIGSSSHTTNPGGTRNVTTTSVAVTGNKDYAACARTVDSHDHTTQDVKVGVTADESDVPSAGHGVHYKKVSQVDDLGVVTTTTTASTEVSVPSFRVSYEAHPHAIVSTVVDRNSRSSATKPGHRGSSGHSTNPGGTRDVTTTTVELNQPDAGGVNEDVFSRTDRTQTIDFNPVGYGADGEVGGGRFYQRSESIDGYGVHSVDVAQTVEKPVARTERTTTGTAFVLREAESDRNRASAPEDTLSARRQDDQSPLPTTQFSMTQGGSYNVTVTKDTPVYKTWEEPVVDMNRCYRRCAHVRNSTSTSFQQLFTRMQTEFVAKCDKWDGNKTPPSSISVTPSCTMNDFGLFDGTVTMQALWSPDSAGQMNSPDAVFTDKTFTEVTVSMSNNISVDPRNGGVSKTTTGVVNKRKKRVVMGRGTDNWDALCRDYRTHLSGSSFSFSPSTTQYSATIYTEIESLELKEFEDKGTYKP